jgi:prephenate dehydrogenase
MRIAILGLGLIGGSLGLALRRSGNDFKVVGVPRRDETLKQAIEIGAVDEGTTDHIKGVADADVVFICTPINLILPVISEISPHLKKGAIITDVGSSKGMLVSQAEKILPKGIHFVGGHPMAGKETAKLEAAEEGLFRNQNWILTRTSKTNSKALEEIGRLVTLTGARALEMDPRTHDLAVAAISHMPLAAAAALVNAVADEPNQKIMARIAASGFRDATRIASGDPILGVDMFTTNKNSVLKMIGAFKKTLSRLEKLIKEGNGEKIREELERAKRFRDSIYG